MTRVIRVVLEAPDGNVYRLDTPDPALIGQWLKELFDAMAGPAPHLPTTFKVTIS
jgi:hypothetical protein